MSFEMPSLNNVSLLNVIPSFLGSSSSETNDSIDFFESVGEAFLPPAASVSLGLFRSWNFSGGERDTRASQWVMPALMLGALVIAQVALTRNPIFKALERSLERNPACRLVVTSRSSSMAVFRLGLRGTDSIMARYQGSHILFTRGHDDILNSQDARMLGEIIDTCLKTAIRGFNSESLLFRRDATTSHLRLQLDSGGRAGIRQIWEILGLGQIS